MRYKRKEISFGVNDSKKKRDSGKEKLFIPNLTPVYRQQCGSVNPTGIIGPAIAATTMSTIVAIT